MNWENMTWEEKINFLNTEANKILGKEKDFSDEQIEKLVDKIDEMYEPETVEVLGKSYNNLLCILIYRGLVKQIDNNELTVEQLLKLKNILEEEIE